MALAIGLVAVWIKALTDGTVTGVTHWVPPPAFGAWKVDFVLTVLPIVAGPAFAGVAAETVGVAHTCCYVLAGVQETRVHTLSSKVPCGDRASISSTSRLLLHPMLPQACHSAKGRSSLPSRSQETNWENMEGSHPRPGKGGMQGCM